MDVKQVVIKSHVIDPILLKPLGDLKPQLILVFASISHFQSADFANTLIISIPDAQWVGCSTAGEISGEGVTDDSVVITAIRFEHPDFMVAHTTLANMEQSYRAGQALAQQLSSRAELKHILVFGQGVSEHTLCAIGFYGQHLSLVSSSFGGWKGFGTTRQITRHEGNILYELDGKPALDLYKRYLGDYAADLPASGLLFPFSMLSAEGSELGIIRTILGIDEAKGSLILAGDLIENGYLQLMHASTDALVDGAQTAAEMILSLQTNTNKSLALLVSCVGRKLLMGGRVDEEVDAVASVFGNKTTLTGFYSNGEISPLSSSTDCKLHNQTMTITCLSEQ